MLIHFVVMFFIIFTMNVLYFYVYHLPLKAAITAEDDKLPEETLSEEGNSGAESEQETESETELPQPESFMNFDDAVEEFTNEIVQPQYRKQYNDFTEFRL